MEAIEKIDLLEKISSNEIKSVLDSLSILLVRKNGWKSYYDRFILIRNRYKENEFKSRAELIGRQEEFLNRNNIIFDLVQLIRDLPEDLITGEVPLDIYDLYVEPSLKSRILSILIDLIGFGVTAIILIKIFFLVFSNHFIEIKFSIFLALIITFVQTKDIISGKSFGKRVTGLVVKDANTGKDANEIQAFIRNLTLVVFPLELYFIFLAQLTSRRLGDVIANTVVVKNSKSYPLFTSFKEDFRKYSFTKEMMLAVVIALITTAGTSIVIWYIINYELEYQF